MDAALVCTILSERAIAYALVDRQLEITQVGGALPAFEDLDESCVGTSLVDLVPELIGSEAGDADDRDVAVDADPLVLVGVLQILGIVAHVSSLVPRVARLARVMLVLTRPGAGRTCP